MVVLALEYVDVKSDASSLREGLRGHQKRRFRMLIGVAAHVEDVRDHFAGEVADFLAFEVEVSAAVGSARYIDDRS